MRKMIIALVQPKSTFLIDPLVYPPLGLWYLAAQIEALGHEVEYYDLAEDKLPLDGEYDQLWVTATSPQLAEVRKIGEYFTFWNKTSTVLGGPAPWSRSLEIEGFDLIVSGECDRPEVITQVIQGAECEKGNHRSRAYNFGTASNMEHILPPVRRWSGRYNAYLEDGYGNRHRTTTMFTSRGCPMACIFCESGRNGTIWDRIVRYEPIEVVEHQLLQIRALGFTGVMFYDDILPLNKPRMLKILTLLTELKLIWRCFIRTDIIIKQGGYEYLKKMAQSGLVEVLAGIESGDNRIKRNIQKGTTIEQDTQVLEWCQDLGIKFKASIILGLPGEDLESMKLTKDWILTHKPDRADVNVLIPFPGTPLTSPNSAFDCYWTEDLPEEFWYKGPRDESNAIVGTSHLLPEEIKTFRNELIQELEAVGIPY